MKESIFRRLVGSTTGCFFVWFSVGGMSGSVVYNMYHSNTWSKLFDEKVIYMRKGDNLDSLKIM